ncbi:MAG: rhodanese-like domain-containing protein [Lachnospiraceae bacterium]|nr:rhodanese-like domain-containing protein [Lachnospiraceae bacterium]
MKTTMKKFSMFMLTLALVFTMAASTGMNSEAASKKPTKITLKATSKTVDIKGRVKVSVKSVKPSKASKSVTYKTSNKKIATVSSKGTVTGKKKGTVKITATSKVNKRVKATIKITVKDLKATSVKLNTTAKTVAAGKSTTLKATVKGATGFYNQGVTWKSSNTKVATVSSKGVVKAVAAGQAKITATEKGGVKKATCLVTVTEPVKVDTQAGTVTVKGIVNASAFKTPTMHYLVTANLGASKGNPVFTGLNDRIDLANALDSLNAVAWNNNPKTTLKNGETIAAVKNKKGTNANYSKLNVSVSWAGHTVSMQDTLKNKDGSAYKGTIIYSNTAAVQKAIPSGCEICTTSCYAGICTSDDVAFGKQTLAKSDKLPKAGTVVTITIGVDGYKAPYNYISKEDLKADIDSTQSYKLIDARKAADYATSHIAGATSADMDCVVNGTDTAKALANVKAAIAGDSKDQKYAVICYSGNRYAQAATEYLIKAGVKNSNIVTLKGGMKVDANGWSDANYLVKSYESTGKFNFKHGMTAAQLEANLNAGNTPFVVFDLRDADAFAKGHIPQAISTPLKDASADFSDEQSKATLKAAVDANPNKFYVVECYSGNKYANKAVNYLKDLGVNEDKIIVLEGGAAGYKGFVTSTIKISAADLKADIDGKQEYKLIDARKDADYRTAHIVGATSADMDCVVNGTDNDKALANAKAAIAGDKADQKYVIICYSGNRYAQAATINLIKAGVAKENIVTLEGGMKGWGEANYLVKSYESTGKFNFKHGMTAAQLKANLEAGNTPFVVFDLRDEASNKAASINGAISTPLCEIVDGKKTPVSDEQAKAVLKAAVEKNQNKFYVVECYSGNFYANKAVETFKQLGVSEDKVIVLEGGAAAWK